MSLLFFLMGQSRPLFVYFRSFITISIQIEKSIDGVLGIQTRGRRMVGADETTELWRPPMSLLFTIHKFATEEYIEKLHFRHVMKCTWRYFSHTFIVLT